MEHWLLVIEIDTELYTNNIEFNFGRNNLDFKKKMDFFIFAVLTYTKCVEYDVIYLLRQIICLCFTTHDLDILRKENAVNFRWIS